MQGHQSKCDQWDQSLTRFWLEKKTFKFDEAKPKVQNMQY